MYGIEPIYCSWEVTEDGDSKIIDDDQCEKQESFYCDVLIDDDSECEHAAEILDLDYDGAEELGNSFTKGCFVNVAGSGYDLTFGSMALNMDNFLKEEDLKPSSALHRPVCRRKNFFK